MDPHLEEAFRRARLGDPRAFRAVAERLGPEIVSFVRTFLRGDVHTANDVAQDTLVLAWEHRADIEDARHLRRWCYRVARWKAISWIRRLRFPEDRKVESLSLVREDGRPRFEPACPAPEATEGHDLLSALHRALRRLPSRYAGPVHLYYVQGLDTRETAHLLGIKRATVKMRLHRARVLLRREIRREVAVRPVPPDPLGRPPP